MQHARSGDVGEQAAELWRRYTTVRNRSTQLIDGLSAEDCQVQSMPDVSPAKWHLAHTTWFFETFVLAESGAPHHAFDPLFGQLFNSYYNSVGRMHPRAQRGLLSRPALETVLKYRRHVDQEMRAALPALFAAGLAPRIELGLQHEEQHQELMLTDIQHVLSCNPLLPAYRSEEPPVSVPVVPTWMHCEAGMRRIGHQGDGFAFDNETPPCRVWLNAFELASRPVTNGEYRSFIQDGGYRDPLLWLADGWTQRQADDGDRPLYWQADLDHAFGLHGLQPLDPDAPVCHLSYYEADAYARWVGMRLPTEAEWESMMIERGIAWNTGEGATCPRIGGAPAIGQVWEWTSSAYAPYPGFRAAPGAIGEYNGKFMCNQFVLRGGSCATPPGHARPSYRNFFPPAARWQFSGLRLARDA
ncbi:MAG: ergothioneine biosynthesis protein EgtB [Sinimarinibacterium sp.]|jgi:ergothioneine biosynthesis protein EgtB